MSHIFRVYYFVGGWSREVRSAVLVADSISRVHAPLNAVVLRKEVVDFSLHLSLSLPPSLFLSLPSPFSFLVPPRFLLFLFLSICRSRSEPLDRVSFTFLSLVEERTRKGRVEKEDRILLRCCCDTLQATYARRRDTRGPTSSVSPMPGRHSSP